MGGRSSAWEKLRGIFNSDGDSCAEGPVTEQARVDGGDFGYTVE